MEKMIDVDILDEKVFGSKKYNNRKRTAQEIELEKLYDSVQINNYINGNVYNLEYSHSDNDYHYFDGKFKDLVRVDNKNSESIFINGIQKGDHQDILILKSYDGMIKGNISQIIEKIVHKTILADIKNIIIIGHLKNWTPAGFNVEFEYGNVTLRGFMPNTLSGINKVIKPEEMVGDKIELMIESYSPNEGTYIVSRKRFLRSLIGSTMDELVIGTEYSGTVTGKVDYGVFVEFNTCLTGMIYKSYMNSETNINEVKPGDKINFFIKEIIENKIILTQVFKETVWDSLEEGQILEGEINSLKSIGALVSLDEDTKGLIRQSDIETIKRQLKEGEKVKVKVESFNRAQRKIMLEFLE